MDHEKRHLHDALGINNPDALMDSYKAKLPDDGAYTHQYLLELINGDYTEVEQMFIAFAVGHSAP